MKISIVIEFIGSELINIVLFATKFVYYLTVCYFPLLQELFCNDKKLIQIEPMETITAKKIDMRFDECYMKDGKENYKPYVCVACDTFLTFVIAMIYFP